MGACCGCMKGSFCAPCGKCGKLMLGPSVGAMGKWYHADCLTCTKCSLPLDAEKGFSKRDGQPYHTECARAMAKPCDACGQGLSGNVVSALGSMYHARCFVCEVCYGQLPGGQFLAHQGKHVCQSCKIKMGKDGTDNMKTPLV